MGRPAGPSPLANVGSSNKRLTIEPPTNAYSRPKPSSRSATARMAPILGSAMRSQPDGEFLFREIALAGSADVQGIDERQ